MPMATKLEHLFALLIAPARNLVGAAMKLARKLNELFANGGGAVLREETEARGGFMQEIRFFLAIGHAGPR